MLSLSHSVARDTRPGPAAAQTTECLNPGQMSKLFSGDSFAKKYSCVSYTILSTRNNLKFSINSSKRHINEDRWMQSFLNQVLHKYLFVIHGTWPGLWLLLIWTWRHLTRSPGLWCIVCNARGHGQRPLARGSSDLFWSSGWRNNKGEDWAAMRERGDWNNK